MAEMVFARRTALLRAISAAAGLGAIVVGVLVLGGWALNLPVLKSVFPGLVTMKANTALAFILAGVSLRLLCPGEAAQRKRRIALACAFLVALVGLLTLGEYLFGRDLGIDQLLFQEPVGAVGTSSPGRMGLNTALNLLLVGSALLLLDVETRRGYRPAQPLTLIAGAISLVALLGYAYRQQPLYTLGPLTSMALHTAFTFVVLCAGILFARPDRGLMAMVTSESAGGVLAGRLLPAAIGITLLLGWLRLEGQRIGLYGSELGVALFAAANILVLAILIWSMARSLDRADREGRQADEALRRSEERYRILFQSSPLPAWVYDINSLSILAVNDAAIRDYGYSGEEFLAMTIKDIRPAEDVAALLESVSKAGVGVERSGAWRHRKKDGTIIEVEIVSHPLTYGGRDARLVVADDITERKRAEEALRQSEERYRRLLESNPLPVGVYDLKSLSILYVNDAAICHFGYSREECLAMTIKDIFPPEDIQALLDSVSKATAEVDIAGVWRLRKKDGTTIHVETVSHKLIYAGRDARLVVVTDITERKRAEAAQKEVEEALRASEARTRSILDTAHEAFVAMDSDGQILDWNPQAEATFGWSRQEAIGRPLAETVIPLRYREAHRRGLRHFLATGEGPVLNKRIELPALHRDGHEFPVEFTISPVPSGQAYYFNAFIHDITERKRAEEELRKRSAELQAANKELEAFSYSVSHDLRAPLRSIDGFSLAALEDCGDRLDARGKDYLQRVRAATQRMAALIDDLLDLSRVTRAEMRRERLDLGALAHALAAELQQAGPHRRVEFVIAQGLEASGDPRLLRVVLENLLGNAWKFTSKHARARIEFGVTQRDGRAAYFVRDDGAGFDPAYAGRLFGAFQRLHAESEFPGTGIGLATVQRIIHRHGGSVWAEGAVGQGATFYFTL